MNIFILSQDPVTAAQMQCNKHIPKMIVESAQMLCTSHRRLDGAHLIAGLRSQVRLWFNIGDYLMNAKTYSTKQFICFIRVLYGPCRTT
jgi:hypothetical protein